MRRIVAVVARSVIDARGMKQPIYFTSFLRQFDVLIEELPFAFYQQEERMAWASLGAANIEIGNSIRCLNPVLTCANQSV